MKAARAGHLCTVQFLISKGALLTSCSLFKSVFVYVCFCALKIYFSISQFPFIMLFWFLTNLTSGAVLEIMLFSTAD